MSYFKNLNNIMNYDLTPYIKVGQISKVHYIDDELNISKKHPEYDVWMFDNKGAQTLLQNVRSINLISGINDYEETILEPSEFASEVDLEDYNTPDKRNGSFVLIAFLDGNFNNPLIIGGLDHPGATPEATKELGIHKKSIYRGLQQVINKDGELEITFTGAKNPDGTPVIEDQVPITFKLGLDGTVSTTGGHSITFTANESTDSFRILTKGGQLFEIEDKEDSESLAIVHKQGSLINISPNGSTQIIASDGSLLFFNTEANEVSLVQKDGHSISMIPDSITIAEKGGSDILSIKEGKVQVTSNGEFTVQASAIGGDAGTVNLKDQVGGAIKISNGQVALGGPAAELLDLFEQLLDQISDLATALSTETHVGNLGFPTAPPTNAADYLKVGVQVTAIKALLTSIKGSL